MIARKWRCVFGVIGLILMGGSPVLRAQGGPGAPRWLAAFGITGVAGTSFEGPTLGPNYQSTSASGDIGFWGTDAKKQRAIAFRFHYSDGRTGAVYQRSGELTVGLNVYGVVGQASLVGPVKSVQFRVGVMLSELPGCAVGAPVGMLSLFDLPGEHDYVILTLCGRTYSYKLGEPGQASVASVIVSIRPDPRP